MKRALVVTYATFLFAFIAPFQVIPRDGSGASSATLLLMAALVVAPGVLAYVLLRGNGRVTLERRASLLAAGFIAALAVAQSDIGDVSQRLASAAALASLFFLVTLFIGVSIHALAYGVAKLRKRSVPA